MRQRQVTGKLVAAVMMRAEGGQILFVLTKDVTTDCGSHG
jgi:hypothetical protein